MQVAVALQTERHSHDGCTQWEERQYEHARPWQGVGNMMAIGRKVCQGDRPPVASGAVGQLVARCWAAEPAARPTMEQALRELAQLA